MEGLLTLLDSLSTSLGKDWREEEGSLCKWVLEGLFGSLGESEEVVSGYEAVISRLDRHFPPSFCLDEADSKDDCSLRRRVKLLLFCLYFGSVKQGWQPLKRALLKLTVPEQHLLERIFSHLLEDHWEDDLLFCSTNSCAGPATTPLSRFRNQTVTSPSSYHNTPSSNAPPRPLNDFFSSPVTTQISKYQRIAEDQKRLLGLMRIELDQEKLDSLNLLKERDELSKERTELKKALGLVRKNLLAAKEAEETNEESNEAYEELQKRLAEKKDTEKYLETLEEQLSQSEDVKDELKRTLDSQRTKLEERSMRNAELDSKSIQLQVSLNLERQLNGDLSQKCNELEIQLRDLQEIIETRPPSASGRRLKPGRKSGDGHVSVADISIDDPMVSSMPSSPEGENMAEALVIPELEEQLSYATQQRDQLQERVNHYEKELTLRAQETSRITDELREAKESNELLKNNLTTSDKEKGQLQASLADITTKSTNLQQDLERATVDLKTSKDNIQALNSINKDLEGQVTSLKTNLSELKVAHSKTLESLSSELNSLKTTLEDFQHQNKLLSGEVEDLQCKESNYANEALERESKIISATEEINKLTTSNVSLKKDFTNMSDSLQSQISELTSSLETLTSEKNELMAGNVDLEKEKVNCQQELEDLRGIKQNLHEELRKLINESKEINMNYTNSKSLVSSLEGQIKAAQSSIDSLESDKSSYVEKLGLLEDTQNKLISLKEASEEKYKCQTEGLLEKNNLLLSELEVARKASESLENQCKSLQVKQSCTEEDISSRQRQLEELTLANDQLKKELGESQEMASSRLSESEGKYDQLHKEWSSKLTEKSQEMEHLQESISLSQKTNQELEEKLKLSNQECEKVQSKLDSLNQKKISAKNTLETQIQGFKEKNITQTNQIYVLQDELQNSKQMILKKEEEIASQSEKLAAQDVELTKIQKDSNQLRVSQERTNVTLENTLKNLKSQVEEKDSMIQELKSKITSMNHDVSCLSKEKSEAEIYHEAEMKDMSLILDNLKSSQADLKLKTEELARIQSELDNMSSFLKTTESNASANLEELKKNLLSKGNELISVKSELEKRLQAKDYEITELQETVTSLKSDLEALQAFLKAKFIENEDLIAESQDMKSKERDNACSLQKEMEALREDAKNAVHQSKSEIESLSSQVQELSGELDLKNKTLHDLKRDFNNLMAEKTTVASTNKQLTADIGKALNAVDKCEKEVTEINHSLPALENENKRLKEELNELQASKNNLESDLKTREAELSSKCNAYEKQLESFRGQLHSIKEKEEESRSAWEISFEKKLSEELKKLENSLDSKFKSDLAAQKKRYEARVKTITESVACQYKAKLEQFSKEKDSEMDGQLQKSKEYENKYNVAKLKISEMVSKLDEAVKENEALQKKYNGSKNMIMKLKEEKEFSVSSSKQHSSDGSLSMEVETLKRQLNKAQTENRTLTVQFSTAELKIRSLQKEVNNLNAAASSQPVLPSCRATPPRDVFKIPAANHDTPGRTRSGRTQSESHFHQSRRPPNGVGALFDVDDEEGEMFSNSYLSDVKEGRCAVNQSGRLSELSRRNTLQPSHLKSSYPVETQFYDMESFKENELKEGKVKVDAITKGTANLSMNSPAMNTRSRRLTIGGVETSSTAAVSPLTTRKRAVALDNSSFNSNSSSFIMRYEAKRSRKEAQQTSYSKPGPPTPAKNKSFHSNTSMNKSSTSEIACLDVNASPSSLRSPHNASNRSLRSRIVDTPLTLKRAIRSTWRKKKSYNMKGKLDENTSVVVLDKSRTPLKKSDRRK